MSNAIQRLFVTVSRTYERINHILTFGMDILWRNRAARLALQNPGTTWLDICTGTGELAAYWVNHRVLTIVIIGWNSI